MKRNLVNFGIFSRSIVRGKFINNNLMLLVYNKLKENKFRETPRQYIFKDQIGGLVLPYNGGRSEIHVRFFKDRIFAEYEIGRSYISHFLGPRYNANEFIFSLLKINLTKDEERYLYKMLSKKNQLDDEKKMQYWDQQNKELFIKKKGEKQNLPYFFSHLFLKFGWKTFLSIAFFLYFILIILKGIPFHPTARLCHVVITVPLIFLWNILPSRGKP